MADDMIRVLIADDHSILRQGIRQILELETDIEVVGEASDGKEAVLKCGEILPDVVLMDVNMPEMNGVQAATELRSTHPDIAILILTIHDDDVYLQEAVAAGVTAYVLKDVAAAELVEAIRLTHSGKPYLHPKMGGRLLQHVVNGSDNDSRPRLTRREQEVLNEIARGLSNKEIASRLVISEKTVKNHVSHILEKLSVSDRLQAVLTGARLGLIEINND